MHDSLKNLRKYQMPQLLQRSLFLQEKITDSIGQNILRIDHLFITEEHFIYNILEKL